MDGPALRGIAACRRGPCRPLQNDAIGDGRVHARERVKHLAPAQPGHPQIANDDIEGLHQSALQRLTPVVCQHDLVSPALERRLHVMEDVRFVINHEHPQVFVPFGGAGSVSAPPRVRERLALHGHRSAIRR